MSNGNVMTFKCVYCDTPNDSDSKAMAEKAKHEKRVVMGCGSCGALNVANSSLVIKAAEAVDNGVGDQEGNWLHCIDFNGPEAKIPAGKITIRGAPGNITYTTAEGDKLSRVEFTRKFGVDPEMAWKEIMDYIGNPEPLHVGMRKGAKRPEFYIIGQYTPR